ncbi:MAG: hypothetical protein LBL46_03170 [Rickettsiales bacterium]|nr:hypothetical protein [Rickettsiales bacterium]
MKNYTYASEITADMCPSFKNAFYKEMRISGVPMDFGTTLADVRKDIGDARWAAIWNAARRRRCGENCRGYSDYCR